MYLGDGKYKECSLGTADDQLAADGLSVLDYRQALGMLQPTGAGPRLCGAGADRVHPGEGHGLLPGVVQGAQEAHRLRVGETGDPAPDLARFPGGHGPSPSDPAACSAGGSLYRFTAPGLPLAPGSPRSRRTPCRKQWQEDPSCSPDSGGATSAQSDGQSDSHLLQGSAELQRRRGPNPEVAGASLGRTAFPQSRQAAHPALRLEETARLLNSCQPDFRALVTGALLTGGRYGGLTAMLVRDFSLDGGYLRLTERRARERKAGSVI